MSKDKETVNNSDDRLLQWLDMIMKCRNRPGNMTIPAWCKQNGISESNYYYRLSRVRDAGLLLEDNNDKEYSNTEDVTSNTTKEIGTKEEKSKVAAILHYPGGITVELLESASSEFLEKIIWLSV